MLIGDDKCFLRIEKADSEYPDAPYSVEARARSEGRAEVFGFNTLVLIDSTEQHFADLTQFAELRSHGWSTAVSEGGTIGLRRDVHGNIDVLFSIGYRRFGPEWKVSGEVHVLGENTQEFLREFKTLLFGQRR
jgi:hypothetical protein